MRPAVEAGYEAWLTAHYRAARGRLRPPLRVPARPVPVVPRKPIARDWLILGEQRHGVDVVIQDQGITIDLVWRRIASEVIRKHGVSVQEMRGQRRDKVATAARQETMYRLQHEAGMSAAAIGRILHRDPTTVASGIEAHKKRIGAEQ